MKKNPNKIDLNSIARKTKQKFHIIKDRVVVKRSSHTKIKHEKTRIDLYTQTKVVEKVHLFYRTQTDRSSSVAIVVNDLGIGDRAGVLNNWSPDGVDPIFLLFLGIGDEVHGLSASRKLESELFIQDVLGAFDGEAGGHRNDASRPGGAVDDGFLKPEKLALLEDEPAATPGLNVLALFGEPAGAFRVRPELDAAVVVRVIGCAGSRTPKAPHHWPQSVEILDQMIWLSVFCDDHTELWGLPNLTSPYLNMMSSIYTIALFRSITFFNFITALHSSTNP